MKALSQQARLLILMLYLGFLFLVSRAAFGTWLPPQSEKGMWFYAGLASLLLGYMLANPHFAPPKDVFSYALTALISIIALNAFQDGNYGDFDRFLRFATISYACLVLITSLAAIFLKDAIGAITKKVGEISYLLCARLGTPKVIFSILYWFALIVFHRHLQREYLLIGLAWAVIVVVQPIEIIADLAMKLMAIIRRQITLQPKLLGEIVGYEFPNLLLIKHSDAEKVDFGDLLIVHGDDGKYGIALALDYIGYAAGRWLRAYRLLSDIQPEVMGRLGAPEEPGAYRLDTLRPDDWVGQNPIWLRRNQFVGVVAPESDSANLRVDITGADHDLREGRLLEVFSNRAPVLYQVINGLTKEEIIQQKSTRGYVVADAKKVGTWAAAEGRFLPAKWVPQPNSPVFIVDSVAGDPSKDAVGHFPGTAYPVQVEDIDKLVTHNTAILGILGVGKSYLAFELIERMIQRDIRVICLDVTNQYALQLKDFYDTRRETRRVKALKRIGPEGKAKAEQNVEEGGSVLQFRAGLRKYLGRFLVGKRDDHLIILDPADFEVWRQDSKPYNNRASMASLTPIEISKLITEVTLEILQELGMNEKAKCCIVFEEAHSLIPEWNSVINEGDKSATNGIARAILQGRKYGLGCLVVTQRTANVTKSILNQCNSVFAMRLFDATGMDFLRNYIGEDYADVLSTLEDRHAVFFGRASSCRDPVLVRLNDRENFLRVFRAPDPPGNNAVAHDLTEAPIQGATQ